jgi:hypothetical protein
MMDIALLNPTFCGLNFSITGNMRAGIFVKDILDKQISTGQSQLNSCDQLRTGYYYLLFILMKYFLFFFLNR